jgi:hypothetical protein
MLTTTNLPCVQGSESEFCPYSGDVGDQFSANLDSSEQNRRIVASFGIFGLQSIEFSRDSFCHYAKY